MDDKILNKIRNILARADKDQNDNEHEREIAMRQASSLLAKHGLSIGDVKQKTEDLGKVGRSKVDVLRFVWIAGIYDQIAKLNNCKVIRGDRELWVIGHRLYVEATKTMAEFLVRSIRREAKINRHDGVQFGNGAWSGISQQVKQIIGEQAQGLIEGKQTGKGLILVDQRKQHQLACTKAVTEFFGKTSKGRGHRQRHTDDRAAGERFGKSVNMNGGSHKRLS